MGLLRTLLVRTHVHFGLQSLGGVHEQRKRALATLGWAERRPPDPVGGGAGIGEHSVSRRCGVPAKKVVRPHHGLLLLLLLLRLRLRLLFS